MFAQIGMPGNQIAQGFTHSLSSDFNRNLLRHARPRQNNDRKTGLCCIDAENRPWHFSRNARDAVLLGNLDGSLNTEFHTCAGLRVAGLCTADKQRVLAASDRWIARRAHHA